MNRITPKVLPALLPVLLPAMLLAGALPAHAQSAPAATAVNDVPLIERAKIFGNASKSGANISPDLSLIHI